jgi:hypothetical protein
MLWEGVLLVLFGILLLYQLILIAWERVGFIGSIEWMIGTIAYTIIPAKRDPNKQNKKWYEKGKLNVQGAFYNVESVSVITPDAEYHANKQDSKMILKLSKIALFSILFMPFSIITLYIARGIKNKKETQAKRPSSSQL